AQRQFGIEPAIVERPAADHAGDAVTLAHLQCRDIGDTGNPARGDDRDADLAGKSADRGGIDPGQGAVAGDIGVDDRGDPGIGEPPRLLGGTDLTRSRPTLHRYLAVASANPDAEP